MGGDDTQIERQSTRIYEYRCSSCDKLHFKGNLAVGLLETKCRCGRFLTFGDHPLQGDTYYTMTLNSQGAIVSASASTEDVLGYRASELLQMHISDITLGYDAEIIKTVFHRLWQTHRNKDELYHDANVIHRKKNGDLLNCHMYWRFIKLPQDDYFFAIFQSPRIGAYQDATSQHVNMSYIEISPDGACQAVSGDALRKYKNNLLEADSILSLLSHPERVHQIIMSTDAATSIHFLDDVHLKIEAFETAALLVTRKVEQDGFRIYIIN